MGFKEFAKFNDAMLAKQVWRLIHDTNSLFYRVFKSKYFPNDTIFDAKQSSGSFAWKIILKARRVILWLQNGECVMEGPFLSSI